MAFVNVRPWLQMRGGLKEAALGPASASAGRSLFGIWSDPSRIFSGLLQTYASNRSLNRTRQLHSLLVTSGVFGDRFITNHLLNAYAKAGDMCSAAMAFAKMPVKNVMSWNIMLGGFIQNADLDSARNVFCQMPVKNVATWSAMVAGATHFGFNEESLHLFYEMRKLGFQPDEFTLGSVLRSSAGMKDIVSGRKIHVYVVRAGFQYDLCVGNSLAHMYMNCQCLMEGEKVLELIPARSVVTYNTVIAGRVQNSDAEGAIGYFYRMKGEGLAPDEITFIGVVTACSELGTIGQANQVHAQVIKTGFASDISIRSSIVSMYSKCGCLADSSKVFFESMVADPVLWSAMIAAYGFHGRGQEAIDLFERMVDGGISPNEITYLSLLYACSHSGLTERGKDFFKLMTETYKLEPTVKHYTCMVDLLGRSGSLIEAEELIKSMPLQADAVIWKTLLSACKNYKNYELAKRVAEQVLILDPADSASYVLLSQIHATSEKWGAVSEVRRNMRDRMVKKEPGVSWVEVRNTIHQFSMGDTLHPDHKEISSYLKELVIKMKLQGYTPDTSIILHDMSDEEKELVLLGHSEKLAISFAILRMPEGSPIWVMKNLRMCNDCHSAIKFISNITAREIIVRDVSRFHHFENGVCSCGDYW